jgi:hypothetical protein
MPEVAAVCDNVMNGVHVQELYCYSSSDNFDYANCTCKPSFKVHLFDGVHLPCNSLIYTNFTTN